MGGFITRAFATFGTYVLREIVCGFIFIHRTIYFITSIVEATISIGCREIVTVPDTEIGTISWHKNTFAAFGAHVLRVIV